MSHGLPLVILVGAIVVLIGLLTIKARRTPSAPDPVRGSIEVARTIGTRDRKQSPAVLVDRARAGLAAGSPMEALNAARRARDRNDDFVNALPSMTGKVPLRPMVYHPAIYEVMLEAFARCRADGSLSRAEAAGMALGEWQAADNDFNKVFNSGDNAFWWLFLSDYLQLCALAYTSSPSHGPAGLTEGVVRAVLSSADQVPSGSLTMPGTLAYRALQRAVGREVPATTSEGRQRPRDYRRFPCGSLIDQVEIDGWLVADRLAEPAGPPPNLPEYVTSRRRHPRPATRSLQELHELSLGQVVKAQSDPDAWWAAVDIALFRWELLPSYDDEAITWVRNIAYDTWAATRNGTAGDDPLWAWNNFVDLFSYCYERVLALKPTIDVARPLDLISAQGHENFFADFLYRTLSDAGDVRRMHAFEYRLYTTLADNHHGGLTAAQAARLRAWEEKFGRRG
jgi:hypothetical protein